MVKVALVAGQAAWPWRSACRCPSVPEIWQPVKVATPLPVAPAGWRRSENVAPLPGWLWMLSVMFEATT